MVLCQKARNFTLTNNFPYLYYFKTIKQITQDKLIVDNKLFSANLKS